MTCQMERVKGIEPSYAAWEAAVLPLNYTRILFVLSKLYPFSRTLKNRLSPCFVPVIVLADENNTENGDKKPGN
jgi:hypothetical protein